jgi:hypothetical protein
MMLGGWRGWRLIRIGWDRGLAERAMGVEVDWWWLDWGGARWTIAMSVIMRDPIVDIICVRISTLGTERSYLPASVSW